MNRRDFIGQLSAAGIALSAFSGRARAETPATLTLNPTKRGPTIPRNFVGLSYESAQLANPAFFSPENKQLIELFRGLSPTGNLRLGGGSSEFTTYSDADPTGPPPFEVFGPDTSKTVKHGTVTSALALRNLRGFLDATGWTCLYGLNLGQGTKENAAAEAAAAYRILGPRLLALQIGNEPDSFRSRYRPATYSPADYMQEWNTFHDAIVAQTPQARFAGPDISNKFAYLTVFAQDAPKHKDVILLTGHYYAMGPARNPDSTLEQLFAPDPKLATMHQHNLPEIEEAIKTAGLPYRMSEGNSCWDGGKPGVSDTFASALWCAQMMLHFANLGWCGVNLHGGGNGFYTPIAGAPSTGFTRRPEYFGIQFGSAFAGATFLDSTLNAAEPAVTAYVLEQEKKRRVVVFNTSNTPAPLRLPSKVRTTAMRLSGPTLESKDGTTFEQVHVTRSADIVVEAHSAMIYEL